MLLQPLVAPTNEGADGSRGGVKDADRVFLDDAPKAIRFRPVGRAFIHHGGRARGERTVDNVTVTGDPADIRGAPVDVVLAQIEDVFRGGINADEIAPGRMQDAFRFAGRTAGVENVKWMLAIEGNGRAVGVDIFQLAMPPDVAAFLDVDLVAGPPENDHPPDCRPALERFIDVVLERDDRAAPKTVIRRDDCGRAAIGDAVAN